MTASFLPQKIVVMTDASSGIEHATASNSRARSTIQHRRTFLLAVVAATGTALLETPALAQPAKVDEKDPQAFALGYVSDATNADAKKFPKYAAGQRCGNCALYQGKPTDPAAPCPLFAGKQVLAGAWCSAWAKKA
jgi:hypothetical protein